MATRKTIVTIEFSKPGIQPPLYLAGSFSDPAWQPKQMQFTLSKDNEYHFHTEVEVEGGSQYQYKFRVGEGDWWALNEDAPTGRFQLMLFSSHTDMLRAVLSKTPLINLQSLMTRATETTS